MTSGSDSTVGAGVAKSM